MAELQAIALVTPPVERPSDSSFTVVSGHEVRAPHFACPYEEVAPDTIASPGERVTPPNGSGAEAPVSSGT